jgi:SAM-dependent methyltransferase
MSFGRILDYLKRLYNQEQFAPSVLGVLVNPFYFIRKAIFRSVRNNALFLGGRLLDFGCGSKPYRHLFTVTEYVGLDVAQSGHIHSDGDVDVFYDGGVIPFVDQAFDSCFSSEVFEHIFDLDYSLSEICRVLKPGGRALFVVPFVWDEHEIPYDFARYSSFGLRFLMEKHGFKLVRMEKTAHFFTVIAQLWNLYLYNLVPQRNILFRLFYQVFIIAPFTMIFAFFNLVAPKRYSLYFNNVVMVEKEQVIE